jgi:hypothetical protein
VISFPFFELFSVEARVYAATLNYNASEGRYHEIPNGYVCPVGGCCKYDGVGSPRTIKGIDYWMPKPEDLAKVLEIDEREIEDFIELWEEQEITFEDLPLVMGLT